MEYVENEDEMNKDEIEKLKKLPFEKALEELESVVAKMESGNLPLEKMMESFERGKILTAICGDKLKSVERKIEILRSKSGDGEWVDFESPPQDEGKPPASEPELF